MATTINRAEPEAQPPDPGVAQTSAAHRKKVILALCCVAQFMVILDLSIVNVALPSIQVGLRFSSADLQWVVNAYAIVFAGFLMLAGRGADVFGQRRTFLAALAVFSVASLAGGLSPTSTFLIVARGVQGLGGAMMAACSLAIITATFAAGPERRHAIALWGAMNGAGGAIGVLLSGAFTQYASWRWVLLVNVPVGIAAFLFAVRFVAEHRSGERRSFDVPGALVLTLGQVLVAYGCVQAGINGWGTAAAWVPIGIGAALLALFPVVESRISDPLVPVKALTPQLKLINLIVLLFSASLFPMWYMGSLYLQQVLSLQPITTGIAFLPMALMILLCASRAGRLVGRFGALPVVRAGLLFMTAGMALFALIQSSGSAIQYIILPGVLMTAGIGLSIVPSTIVATQSAGAKQAGLASGLVNTSRQVGGGLGLAILVSIATSRTSALIGRNVTAPQALTSGFRLGYLIGAGLIAAALLLTFQLARAQRAAAEQPQPASDSERSKPTPKQPQPASGPTAAGRRSGIARSPHAVLLAAALVVAVFTGVAFGLPRSHGKPLGAFTTKGAYTFVSTPNLHPPRITGGATAGHGKLPGDLLLANFYDLTRPPIVGQSGPLILDPSLQPLWFKPVPINDVAGNLTAQTYQGKPVLTWWQGNITPTGQTNTGEDIVVNQHYQRITTLKGKQGWVITLHEMVIKGHDAWVTANKNVPAQLAKYGGVNGGAMIDSAVQEYDLRTGKLVYNWVASKHIAPSDSETQPPANGFPWDAYHVNSIDPLDNGKFLVSMRNTWGVYLVDMKTGKILWTLGGKHSSFKVPHVDQFQWQHDATLTGPNTLSVFDDHCCDITGAGVYLNATGPSRGMVLKLFPSTHTVRLVRQYSHGVTVESRYMGNVQQLPGGKTLVGWGDVPFISEFDASGKLIYDAAFPEPNISYRAYIHNWVGLPLYPPVGAARHRGTGTTVFASWNGATRVASWKVLALGAGQAARRVVAARRKSGFETAIPVAGSAGSRFEVQALNRGGRVIGTSKPFGIR